MKTSVISFFLLSLISGSLASVGDKCGWAEKKGTCQYVSDCDGGFTFNDACPNDGPNIKCCVKKECVKVQKAPLVSLGGRCYDKRNNKCAGGHYERNLCPGDNNVQCCIKDPSPASQDPPPKEPSVTTAACEAIKVIPIDNGFDHLLYSKETTQLFIDVASNVGRLTEVCARLAARVKAKQVGFVCDASGLPLKNLERHAKECLRKNQCLKVKAYSVPYCVGKEDGCCSSESVGTWVNP